MQSDTWKYIIYSLYLFLNNPSELLWELDHVQDIISVCMVTNFSLNDGISLTIQIH